MDSLWSGLSWGRGLRGAAAGAVLGALTLVVGLGLVTLVPWLIRDVSAFDRTLDVAWFTDRVQPPTIVCSLICACAGWATFAPRGKHSFAWSLVIVMVISYPVIATAWAIAPPPQALKGRESPPLEVWRLILLISTPIIIASSLSHVRRGSPAPAETPDRRSPGGNAPNEN